MFYLKRSTDDMELILNDSFNSNKYDHLMPTFSLTPKMNKNDSITFPNSISPTLTRHNRSKSMPNLCINEYANPFTHNYNGNQHNNNVYNTNGNNLHVLNNGRISNIIANMKLTPMDYKVQQIRNKQKIKQKMKENNKKLYESGLTVLKNKKLMAVGEQNSVDIFKDDESLETNESSFEGTNIPLSLEQLRMAVSDSKYIENKSIKAKHEKQVSWKDLNTNKLQLNLKNDSNKVRSKSVDG